jgi:N-acetylmuramoyl-L-alanine amidase
MKIVNHRLINTPFVDTPNKSGQIDPKFIVMHYTAGWTAESAIDTLKNPSRQASAHVVLDYDGSITQMVPFNTKAWHAGRSRYQGYNGLNSYSIGIEIVNIGWLRKIGNDLYQDAYGNKVISDSIGVPLIEAKHSTVGSGMFYWPSYTKAQLDALEELSELFIEEYDIIDIISHEEIDTRGWKTDPGPAFPMNRFKALLRDRGVDEDVFEVVSETPLNVRTGPGTRFGVVTSLPRGSRVSVEETDGKWGRIDSSNWVHTGFLRRV